ncbi:MAG: hypothetical protein HC822_21605, partial [Oscillochloris sp.]|nr:hypothetical protein [Oscillochloris sp.]
TVEFALKDGVPYAIDFTNPAPDFDVNSLTPHYFDWIVHTMADFAISEALKGRQEPTDYAWGQLIGGAAAPMNAAPAAPITPVAAASAAPEQPAAPAAAADQNDALIDINGIGPVFEQRLNAAGVRSFAQLAGMAPERVHEIIGVTRLPVDAEAWIAEAPSSPPIRPPPKAKRNKKR